MPYSQAFKDKMVQKMTGPRARSASQLAAEVGLPQPTLSRWLREADTVEPMSRPSNKRRAPKSTAPAARRPQDWSAEEKLRVVLEASALADEDLGALLRREGLHEAQLAEWREVVLAGATAALSGPSRREKKEANKDRLKIRALEREMRRKEKALAEAAALLVLQKKLQSIDGDEDDDSDPRNGR